MGVYVGVAPFAAGLLVTLALASVGVVLPVATVVFDEGARREEDPG